jgi:hypothetical protein
MVFGYVYLSLQPNFPSHSSTLGIPFNDSVDWRLAIAEKGQQILGDNLLGLQAGNEPDCSEKDIVLQHMDLNDIGNLIQAMEADPGITRKNMLICPSVATGAWTPEQVWDTGFIQTYGQFLAALSVEQ